MLATAGLGGIGGGGGRGNDAGITEPSPESKLPESGKGGGGGGGGGGTSKSTSSDSGCDDDVDAPPLAEAADRGILGPIDDLSIGGFPGGGAPVGLSVGW